MLLQRPASRRNRNRKVRQGDSRSRESPMSRVFTGKVVIPGDKIQEGLQVMKEAEKERAPFVEMAERTLEAFIDHLQNEKGLSRATVRRHVAVIEMFNEFLARQTDVWAYAEVIRGVANTHFKAWYKRKVWGGPTLDPLPVSIRTFFEFLAEKKRIRNEGVLGK